MSKEFSDDEFDKLVEVKKKESKMGWVKKHWDKHKWCLLGTGVAVVALTVLVCSHKKKKCVKFQG